MSIVNKKRRLRIMWCSNSPWAYSGYGTQTADMERKFLEAGWDATNFALINMWGQQGSPFKDEHGILNFPIMNHTQGSDAMLHHGRAWNADIIIGLFDMWVQNPVDLQQIKNFIPWCPIDYNPVVKGITNNLRYASRIIAMSKFGQEQLRSCGFYSTYIPHHVDTNIFKPLDKAKIREKFKIAPDTLVFGMVAENKSLISRKSYQQVLEAYAEFLKKSKQPSLLYIHTNPDFPGGFPIKTFAEYLGIAGNLAFPDQYQLQHMSPRPVVNEIYNMFDIFLNPSSTEGFGIPIIEAQAVGLPVIVNDWCSMPELIRNGATGIVVKNGYKQFMPAGGYVTYPDVADLTSAMLRIQGWDRKTVAPLAVAWAKQFAIDKIWNEKWNPFLERVEDNLYGPASQLTLPKDSV